MQLHCVCVLVKVTFLAMDCQKEQCKCWESWRIKAGFHRMRRRSVLQTHCLPQLVDSHQVRIATWNNSNCSTWFAPWNLQNDVLRDKICRWLLKAKNSEPPEMRPLTFTVITQKMSICIIDSWFDVVALCSINSGQRVLISFYILHCCFCLNKFIYMSTWISRTRNELRVNYRRRRKYLDRYYSLSRWQWDIPLPWVAEKWKQRYINRSGHRPPAVYVQQR
jgi:hypothetical protein